MPAMCSVAANAVAARPAETESAIRLVPAKNDIVIIAGAGLLVLTLTMGAFGSAWVLRAKPTHIQEAAATANADPRSNLDGSKAPASNKVDIQQSRTAVERIAQPHELVEVMPAGAEAAREDDEVAPTKPAVTDIGAKACGGPPEAATTHGTALEFAATPAEALKQAAKEHKLVFLLHISGNFEESGFT
jgi:hypothetical protein